MSEEYDGGREQYLRETHSGENPGSCMMVPTGAFGEKNIGIGHFGFDFNHCNMHLAGLAQIVKEGVDKNSKFKGNIFAVPGVSDGVSMGYDAMRHSLVSRDTGALSIINHVSAAPYEGIILIPGCDKNMPASAIALMQLNIPGYIMCGGSIMPGNLEGRDIDIVTTFIADGKRQKNEITEQQRMEILMNACPGPGACGGMYTANSMFTLFEAMGLTPLHSSSTMAINKSNEAYNAYQVIENMYEKGLTYSNIISRESFENAVRIISVLGGSTNPVLHLLTMARAANISFTERDFENVSRKTPFLGNLMPSGLYRMKDLSEAGGTPAVLKYMLENGHLDGNIRTITGRTLGEDLEQVTYDRNKLLGSGVIASFDNPNLERGHLVLLQGNIGTGWTKVSGSGMESYEGKAVVFDSQVQFFREWDERVQGEGDFIVIRYEGPKGSPGCPEMLKPSTALVGKFGQKARIGLMTDGRFSGGSVGGAPIIGHVDEAYTGGLIGIIQDGDRVKVDPSNNSMNLLLDKVELARRLGQFSVPAYVLEKIQNSPADLRMYHNLTISAREGASMAF